MTQPLQATGTDWSALLQQKRTGAPAASRAVPKSGIDWSAALAGKKNARATSRQTLEDGRIISGESGDPATVTPGPQVANKAGKGYPNQPPEIDLAGLAAQGATLGGADELFAATMSPAEVVRNLLSGEGPTSLGENYDQLLAYNRDTQAATEEARPYAATASEFGGSVLTAPLAAAKALQAPTLIGKVLKLIASGAAYGGAHGFLDGQDGASNRLENAKEESVIGGATALGMMPVAKVAGAGARFITNKLADRAIASRLGVTTEAAKKVSRPYADDAATGGLTVGDDADMLLNTGRQLQGSAEGLATKPGRSQNVLEDAIYEQKARAGARVKSEADKALGSDRGRVKDLADAEIERKAAGKLYDVAKASSSPVYIGEVRSALDSVIEQSDGSVRAALERLKTLRAFADPKEGTRLHRSAVDLHAARVEIDDSIRAAGLGTNTARLLGHVRKKIDEALKDSAPGYKEADAAYSTAIKGKEALEDGRKVFTRSYGSPDELKKEMQGMSYEIRGRFISGARDYISELMGTSRNDAGAVIRELNQKGWNREKLAVILGESRSQEIERSLTREARRQGAADKILGNSATARRLQAEKGFENPLDPAGNAFSKRKNSSATGLVMEGLGAALDKIKGTAHSKNVQQVNEEVAKLLTSSGVERDKIVKILAAATKKRGKSLSNVERIDALVIGLGLGGAATEKDSVSGVFP